MKQAIIIIFFIIQHFTLFSQVNNIDLMRLDEYLFDTELQESVFSFKSNFSSSTNIPIYDYKALPSAIFRKKEQGLDVAESNIKDYVINQSEYYILFVSRYSEENFIDEINVYHNLPTSELSDNCNNKLEVLVQLAKARMMENFEALEKDPYSSNLSKKIFFDILHDKISSNCEMNGEDWVPQAIALEFDVMPLNGLKFDYETYVSVKPDKEYLESRNGQCTMVDYTDGEFKGEIGSSGSSPVVDMINEALGSFSGSHRTILLTYKDITNNVTLEGITAAEKYYPPCDRTTIIFFPGEFSNGEDQVLVNVIDKAENDLQELALVYEQIKEDYYWDGDASLLHVDWRFKNLKSNILNFCVTNQLNSSPFIMQRCDYNLGLAAGIGDGLIETVDFLSIATQYLAREWVEFQSHNPVSFIFYVDLIETAWEKNSIYLAFKYKYNESWDYWVGLVDNYADFFDGLLSDMAVLASAIGDMLQKWYQDATFKNGIFDAGYAHGKAVFEVILEIALAVGTGGAGNIGKGFAALVKVSKEAGETVFQTIAKKLDEAIPTQSQLDDMAVYLVQTGKYITQLAWKFDALTDEMAVAINKSLNHFDPARFAPAMQLAGVTVPSAITPGVYKNIAEEFIVKAKNAADEVFGEIDAGTGGAIIKNGTTPGQRTPIIIGEKVGEEMIAKVAASLPHGCKEILETFPMLLLDALAHIGDDGLALASKLKNKNEVIAYQKITKSLDTGIAAKATDYSFIKKFDDIVQNNSLGLDADGLQGVLNAAANKGQLWEEPGKILDAVERASNANISDLVVAHKKFPVSSNGNSGFLVPAKLYQKAASKDANLSFELSGRSFDDVASTDGKLIDKKFGHGNSIFDLIENDFKEVNLVVHNPTRVRSLLKQAKGQLDSAAGHPIRWEISTELGANGINSIFNGNFPQFLDEYPGVDFSVIEVIHVPL